MAGVLMRFFNRGSGDDQPTPVDGIASWPPPDLLGEALRLGYHPPERSFDHWLPTAFRTVSSQYWTPLAVAAQAARWIEELRIQSVVDIGAGVGKFCIVAGLASSARYLGIEQRPRLVVAAKDLARRFKVHDRVSFQQGIFGQASVPKADAYYLFNPFGENLFDAGERLDEDVQFSDERYLRDIGAAELLIHDAPLGTYIITYNGFGGKIPNSYEQVRVNRELPSVLRVWRKLRNHDSGNIPTSDAS
jgi:hypothetical protein